MAANKQGIIIPACLVDTDANTIDSVLLAGVRRLRVESTPAAGVAPLNIVTMAAPTFATVGVASGVIVAANATRLYISLVNDSANTIWLAFGAAAVVGSGTRLNANGGALVMGANGLSRQDIRGIALVAGSNVTVQEGA